MAREVKIKNALISVYHKDNLEEIIKKLKSLKVKIYSTGGTYDFIHNLGVKPPYLFDVESLTSYPSILGGRVKTLHPKIFGGILSRRDNADDNQQREHYEIPEIDLVIVDLYPFEKTVASTTNEADIIEKIDIGGISLIRAAAKNYNDVICVSSQAQYGQLLTLLNEQKGVSSLADRKSFALQAFNTTSHYDTAIFNYFNRETELLSFKQSVNQPTVLRYGENPHQKGIYHGDLEGMFEQLHGKELSYNNLIDVDAAVCLMNDIQGHAFAILKHNNACGMAIRPKLVDAWKAALEADPVSAFGGVIITNSKIDAKTAEEMDKLFMEIVVAPDYEDKALEILKSKKNRIILKKKPFDLPVKQFRSVLNGVLEQDRDMSVETTSDMKTMTISAPTLSEMSDLAFANILVKHTKSNTIILAKDNQLLASGTGQTSRVDALKQAIAKAKEFGFDLKGAVMASDAFFPFPDCVEIAGNEGITAVIQPGGSIKDQLSIDYCNAHNMSMVFTGIRHFKH